MKKTYLLASTIESISLEAEIPSVGVFLLTEESRDVLLRWYEETFKIVMSQPNVEEVRYGNIQGLTFMVMTRENFERICGKHSLDSVMASIGEADEAKVNALLAVDKAYMGLGSLIVDGGKLTIRTRVLHTYTLLDSGPIMQSGLKAFIF